MAVEVFSNHNNLVSLNRCNSKRVRGSGLGLWARPSAMTRIPGKSFSPQYPKLLNGPLNFLLVKTLLSRNFCQKCVRLNFRNFHNVVRIFSRNLIFLSKNHEISSNYKQSRKNYKNGKFRAKVSNKVIR